ncbi:hypothetical protein J2T20_004514 [Paenibacillus wynnii]|nr:hypothetical protein [Paenibacillus wynnii]
MISRKLGVERVYLHTLTAGDQHSQRMVSSFFFYVQLLQLRINRHKRMISAHWLLLALELSLGVSRTQDEGEIIHG